MLRTAFQTGTEAHCALSLFSYHSIFTHYLHNVMNADMPKP